MKPLKVNDILRDKILVSRESAHLLEDALTEMLASVGASEDNSKATSVVVDFSGVEGIAPSFLDELLSIFESIVGSESGGAERSLVVANPPTRLSLKFEAVARGHQMSVRSLPDNSWLLEGVRDSGS